jgi:hypothetical protein
VSDAVTDYLITLSLVLKCAVPPIMSLPTL